MNKLLKNCFLLLMIIIVPVFFCSCTAQETNKEEGKILIVYLSRTNNTKELAEIIKNQIGGELLALELKEPYPENYKAIVAQVAEENELGYLPPLKIQIDNLNEYSTIFIGFPTWGMQLPPPVKSFLNKYSMSGKTVIPFNTNAGYGVGSSFETIKEMCPNATVLRGFSAKGGIERDGIYFVMKSDRKIKVEEEVTNWLQQIKFL